MPLINGGGVIANLELFRVVHIAGRYGSHKTALAFHLAYELYKAGRVDRIISNVPCVWNDDLETLKIDDPKEVNTAIVLDEGGLYLDERRVIKDVMAGLRKMNVFLIIPSITAPSMKLRFFTINMAYTLHAIGIPMVVYRTILDTGTTKDKSHFGWLNPDTYGIYSTKALPVDAEDIFKWLAVFKDQLSVGRRKMSDVAGRQQQLDFGNFREYDYANEGFEAAEEMAAAVAEARDLLKPHIKRGLNPFK
jgi:hypothetical protein